MIIAELLNCYATKNFNNATRLSSNALSGRISLKFEDYGENGICRQFRGNVTM